MKRKPMLAVLAAAVLAVAAAGTWYVLSRGKEAAPPPTGAEAKKERKILYWTDPMIPGFKSDKPGLSPMGMEMVPVYEDEAAGGEAVVAIRPEIIQNLGMRTYEVARGAQPRRLRVNGYVQRVGSEVLVLADVFERGADWLRAGLSAEVQVDALPGRTFTARVESVEPDIGVGARSQRVVLRLDPPDAALKSNMVADIAISAPMNKSLAIPREALIRTGTRTAVVLALPEGRFQPVEVVPGAELGDLVEIVKGVNEGDVVVTSGQFLLDSEASVRASFERMTPANNEARP